MKNVIAVIGALLFLAGCVSTNEVALAPNVLRIDANASGYADVGKSNAAMMKQAATSTINRGYTHFITGNYQRQTGSQIVGMSSNTFGTGNATGYGYGNTYNSYGSFNANTNTNVWRAPTESTSMMIMMFKADDEIPPHAWSAQEVLAKEGKM